MEARRNFNLVLRAFALELELSFEPTETELLKLEIDTLRRQINGIRGAVIQMGEGAKAVSLDLYLNAPTCDKCHYTPDGLSFNATYNLGPMWRAAVKRDESICEGFEGKTADETLPGLKEVLKTLQGDPEGFKQYNPENGLGDYTGFVKFISDLIEASEAHPTWKWDTWR